jgi:hypothetical protein
MAKPFLRVDKWRSNTPMMGICTGCDQQFKVLALGKTKENLQQQFEQHQCVVRSLTCVTVPHSDRTHNYDLLLRFLVLISHPRKANGWKPHETRGKIQLLQVWQRLKMAKNTRKSR